MARRWRTLSIFISSTFRDMHAERDYLRTEVFAELEERLRARRCHLEPIDLRLGVESGSSSDEAEREIAILKVCIDEIERSRPFLLVLLGNRYGWVPPPDRIESAAKLAGLSTPMAGRSVTALEIEYATLRKNLTDPYRCFFYFRDPLPYVEMPPDLAAQYSDAHSPDETVRSHAALLDDIKRRIEADPDLGRRVRRYSVKWNAAAGRVEGLNDLGAMVLHDLWNEILPDTEADVGQATSWAAEEATWLEEFIEDRARCFVGREALTAQALRLISNRDGDGAWGLCVSGARGAGKSAWFAHVERRIANDPDVIVLTHAAGISTHSTQVDRMLRRWIIALADRTQTPVPVHDDDPSEMVEKAFVSLVMRASVRMRLVFLIDGLDRFETTSRAAHMTWLPKRWPANARLLVTTAPGRSLESLGDRRGMLVETFPPLTTADQAEISTQVSRRFHRVLPRDVLAVLFSKHLPDGTPAAASPLWLTLAVEELNLLDADDFARADRMPGESPQERLRELMVNVTTELPTETDGLYGWVLDRAERAVGLAWTRALTVVLSLGRSGWREQDLRQLVPEVAGFVYGRRHRTVGRPPVRLAPTWVACPPLSKGASFAVGIYGFANGRCREGGVRLCPT